MHGVWETKGIKLIELIWYLTKSRFLNSISLRENSVQENVMKTSKQFTKQENWFTGLVLIWQMFA